MRWYAVLFWIWVVVSLGIFVWRRVNRPRDADDGRPVDEPSSALTKQWAAPPPDPDAPPATAPEPSTEDGPDGTGSVTPPPSPPAATSSSPGPPPSLPDLLQGIALPHGLVPLTQAAPTGGPITSLVAATELASAEQVGRDLADEIERLGYRVTTTGDRTALAEGPRGAVEIEIHPHAGSVSDGGALRFPTAAPGSVVVELRVAGSRR